MFASLSNSTISVVSIMFCGHLGALELAVAGLANSVLNVTGLAVAYGLLTACDTLFAQVRLLHTTSSHNLPDHGVQFALYQTFL